MVVGQRCRLYCAYARCAAEWVILSDPMFRFPSSYSVIADGVVSFAVAHQPIHPTRGATRRRAHISPVTITSPALLLGIVDRSGNATVDPVRMASAVEPNLQALLAEYAYQYPVGKVSSPLPPWLVVFGVYFHSDSVSVLAHVPTPGVFHSILVDTLPYPPNISSNADLFSRLQLAIALLVLRDHVSRINGIFSTETVWPQDVRDDELAIIHEMTGIYTPTPSEESETSDIVMPSVWVLDESPDDDSDDEVVLKLQEKERVQSRQLVERWLTKLQS